MTSVTTSTHFFQNGNSAQFEYMLNLYPEVLKLKAENRGPGKKAERLIRLDEWYQNTLPKLIQKRGPKDAHLLHEELCQTMEWKQNRGKSYPQLSYLIKINTPRAVMMETKKAFRKLPNLEQALQALSNLKGVGTTMASALLAAACPQTAPFMADECLMAIPEFESIDYTAKEYLKFVTYIQQTMDRLNKEVQGPETENNGENGGEEPKPKKWSAHKVELALWAHAVASDLQPDLLKGMPESNGIAGGSAVTVSVANGSAASAAASEVSSDVDNEDDSSQNGVPPSDESNLDSESASKDAVLSNGIMNADSMDGSENGVAEAPATGGGNVAAAAAAVSTETTAGLPVDSLDDCTKSGDSLDEAPAAVEATAAAVATLCTADGEDSQSSNSQKRPLYCDENSEEQPELSAPKLIKL